MPQDGGRAPVVTGVNNGVVAAPTGPATRATVPTGPLVPTTTNATKQAVINAVNAANTSAAAKTPTTVATAPAAVAPAEDATSGSSGGSTGLGTYEQVINSAPVDSSSILQNAIQAVQAYLNPQIQNINSTGQEDQQTTNQQEQLLQGQNATQQKNIGNIYGLLSDQLGTLGSKSNNQFGATQAAVGNAYDTLQNQIGTNFGNAGSQNAATDQALGINATNGQNPLAEGQGNFKSVADMLGTTDTSALAGQKQAYNSLFGSEQGQAKSTGAFEQAQMNTLTNTQLDKLQQSLENELGKLSADKQTLLGGKNADVTALYQKLLSAAQAAAATEAYRAGTLAVDDNKVDVSQQNADTSSAKALQAQTDDEYTNNLKAATADKTVAQTLAIEGTGSATGKAATAKGVTGAENYIAGADPSNAAEYANAFTQLMGNSSIVNDLAKGDTASAITSLKNISSTLSGIVNEPGSTVYANLQEMLLTYLGKG